MPVAEGFRTWVRCPPPPPMQPGRTALLGLDEIEDLEGGLVLLGRPESLAQRPGALALADELEGDTREQGGDAFNRIDAEPDVSADSRRGPLPRGLPSLPRTLRRAADDRQTGTELCR